MGSVYLVATFPQKGTGWKKCTITKLILFLKVLKKKTKTRCFAELKDKKKTLSTEAYNGECRMLPSSLACSLLACFPLTPSLIYVSCLSVSLFLPLFQHYFLSVNFSTNFHLSSILLCPNSGAFPAEYSMESMVCRLSMAIQCIFLVLLPPSLSHMTLTTRKILGLLY